MTAELFTVAGCAALLGLGLAWPRGFKAFAREGAWWFAAVLVAGGVVVSEEAVWVACVGVAGLWLFRKASLLRASVAALLVLLSGGVHSERGGVVAAGLALAAAGVVFLGRAHPPARNLEAARWLIQCGVAPAKALAFLAARERRWPFLALTFLAALALMLVLARGNQSLELQARVALVLLCLRWLSQQRALDADAEEVSAMSFRPLPPPSASAGPLTFDERPPDGSEHLFRE